MKTKTTPRKVTKTKKSLPFPAGPIPVIRVSRALKTYRMGSRWSFVQVNGVDKRAALKAYAGLREELYQNGLLPVTPQVCELLR